MELAKVVNVNWDSHSVDLVMMLDGRPMNGVRVMSSSASTDTGLNDLSQPDVPASGDAYKIGGNSGTRDIIACVDYFGDLPVVMGFLHPQFSQMLFSDKERMVYRHASDVYETIDKDGNFEFYHPSGAFVRVAVASAHHDLTGQDFDGLWKITRNTDKQVHIHVEQAGGTASVDIAPNGAIAFHTNTTANITAVGNVTVHTDGNALVEATGTAEVKGATINLNGGAMKGIVQGDCLCAFTGAPHGMTSSSVKGSA
jgi:hypothetical protein